MWTRVRLVQVLGVAVVLSVLAAVLAGPPTERALLAGVSGTEQRSAALLPVEGGEH